MNVSNAYVWEFCVKYLNQKMTDEKQNRGHGIEIERKNDQSWGTTILERLSDLAGLDLVLICKILQTTAMMYK